MMGTDTWTGINVVINEPIKTMANQPITRVISNMVDQKCQRHVISKPYRKKTHRITKH